MTYSAGLYIGADFIDLAVLSSSGGKLRIVKSVRSPLYQESDASAAQDKSPAVYLALKKTLEAAKLPVNSVNFCLPQHEVMVRRFKMPYLPSEERPSALKFEAQKYLPFKIDEVISDFCIVAESREARIMDALFVAVNKSALDKYLSNFNGLKTKLNIIDIIPFALLRLLSLDKRLKETENKVLIYVEENLRASVMIINDKNPYLVREVALSSSKDILFESILNNVRLSVDYFKRETKEPGIESIILCGDPPLAELETYLKENIPAVQIETFVLEGGIEDLSELSKKQMVAIGLAMASLEKAKPKINLLVHAPQAAFEKGVKEYKPLMAEAVAAIAALTLLQLVMNLGVAQAKRDVVKISSEIPAIKGIDKRASLEVLTAEEAKYQQRLASIRNLAGDGKLVLTDKLNSIGRLLPQEAWVESFLFNDEIDRSRGFRIEGIIYSKEGNETAVANTILSNMKSDRNFSLGFNDIKISTLKKAAAYNKEVLSFSVEGSGEPLHLSE